ncbi:hypothetical protein, partial [Escherichia coli]
RLRAALAASGPVRIAGDLGILRFAPAPFGGGTLALGATLRRVDRLLEVTPSTAIYFSETLGAAYAASMRTDESARLEPIGELPGTLLPLYALR